MNTDRELLELAAEAAGIVCEWKEVIRSRVAEFQTIKHTKHCGFYAGGKEWNPIEDDGDALRLAVKCGILNLDDALFYGDRTIDFQDDPYAATRRAIVRAAAEIGRSM